jgi:hypothetical protein
LFVDILLYFVPVWLRRLEIVGDHAEGGVHQFDVAGFGTGVFYQSGRF